MLIATSQFSAFNRSLFIILIAMFVSSCEPAPLTNGKPVTETRQFDDSITITSLYFYNDINVTLIEDEEFRIEITTGENLMEKITSTVENGALYLKNENIRYWLRSYDYPLDVKVYHNSIRHINYVSWGDLKSEGPVSQDTINHFDLIVEHGSGDIDLNLNCKTLNIKAYDGTAKITVTGYSDYTDIYHNTRNNIYAKDLISKNAKAHIDHEGSIYVNCTNKLEAIGNHFGSIYYNRHVKEINKTITQSPAPNSRGVIEPYN